MKGAACSHHEVPVLRARNEHLKAVFGRARFLAGSPDPIASRGAELAKKCLSS